LSRGRPIGLRVIIGQTQELAALGRAGSRRQSGKQGVNQLARPRTLTISVPAGETRVLKYFQEGMPYGLFVPDIP
jgi:hypothetical protein